MNAKRLDQVCEVASALADPTRLSMLASIAMLGARGVQMRRLAAAFRVSGSTVHHHVERLRRAGLVRVAPLGRLRVVHCVSQRWSALIEAIARTWPSVDT